jgi:hypothetical protein
MGINKLREPYTNSALVDANGIAIIPIIHNAYERVLEVQQITVNYASQGDNPNVQITLNGEVYSGGAVMLTSNGKGSAGGLAQTFGGLPYLYMESNDKVQVEVSNGSLGTLVSIRVQYRSLSYDAPELDGY